MHRARTVCGPSAGIITAYVRIIYVDLLAAVRYAYMHISKHKSSVCGVCVFGDPNPRMNDELRTCCRFYWQRNWPTKNIVDRMYD